MRGCICLVNVPSESEQERRSSDATIGAQSRSLRERSLDMNHVEGKG
jgi:hypothetical protein